MDFAHEFKHFPFVGRQLIARKLPPNTAGCALIIDKDLLQIIRSIVLLCLWYESRFISISIFAIRSFTWVAVTMTMLACAVDISFINHVVRRFVALFTTFYTLLMNLAPIRTLEAHDRMCVQMISGRHHVVGLSQMECIINGQSNPMAIRW